MMNEVLKPASSEHSDGYIYFSQKFPRILPAFPAPPYSLFCGGDYAHTGLKIPQIQVIAISIFHLETDILFWLLCEHSKSRALI
ncbi:hypothetical protein BDDG_12437 [Blastomyces dermatitidis ATCC 18188]|uniref:Uncharacterized protein n=1 Tax=Ajellomyces dermatitidis (strain ATCC 18188 / CBS 674.68) TaxID=653446 RepID=A0A0J9HFQ4_AJEDA|nr:hypothetical protein BDDG_12437 [Blastomyces dermatitidis ATCC 18188]